MTRTRVREVDKSTDHNINVKENAFLERHLKKTLFDTLTRAVWYGLLSTYLKD